MSRNPTNAFDEAINACLGMKLWLHGRRPRAGTKLFWEVAGKGCGWTLQMWKPPND